METIHLKIATLRIRSSRILEIEVLEGVELTNENIQEFQKVAADKLTSPIALLINRKNPYEHTAGSLEQIVHWNGKCVATAVVCEFKVDFDLQRMYESIYDLKNKISIDYFDNLDEAVSWLNSKLD